LSTKRRRFLLTDSSSLQIIDSTLRAAQVQL
jgi:hypothetical protein